MVAKKESGAVNALESAPAGPAGADDRSGSESSAAYRGIHLSVRAELGRTRMKLKDAVELEAGAVVDLDRKPGDPVDLLVEGVVIARGVVLVVDDCFCVRITEVLSEKEESAP